MEVIVADDQLSLAIGKRGQNVRLAAQLTGWRLDIKSENKLEAQLAGIRAAIAAIDGLGDIQAGILVHEGIKSPGELADMAPRSLARMLNLEVDDASKIIESAIKVAEEMPEDGFDASEDYAPEDAIAVPTVESHSETQDAEDEEYRRRVEMFMALSGVGEATAHSMADAGYSTIGDVIADSADEVAQKSGLSLGIARTVQIAADKFLQDEGHGSSN
ncbi:MAG: helix-hairpin-helix domain-containing protein [Bdellovibrionota bacterium]